MSQRGARRSVANFVHPDSATAAPRATGEVESQSPQIEDRGHDRVVRVRVQGVRREREGHPAEDEPRREGRAPESTTDEKQTEYDEQVEGDRRRVGRRQRVPLPGPGKHERRGHVGEVGDRPVRVAAGKGRLAAAVVLDPVANRAVRVLLATGPLRAGDGHVPVRGTAVEDPVAADHAGVADVDHSPRRLEVEADAETPQKDRNRREQPDGPEESGGRGPATETDPAHAHEEVGERWRGERRAPEHVATVEEPERETEREQHEQVERMPASKPPPVGKADEEDRAERDPHPPGVEDLPAERPDPAPCHAPRDLWARPCLGDAPVAVLDPAEGDLPCPSRPDLDSPPARRLVERGVRRRIGRVPLEPACDLRYLEEAGDDCALRHRRPVRLGGERLIERVGAGSCRRSRRRFSGECRGGDESSEGACEGNRHCRALHRRRNDQSLFPTKLSGVTSTIAMAWAGRAPRPAFTSR